MLKPIFYDCSDQYILVSGNITFTTAGAHHAAKRLDERNNNTGCHKKTLHIFKSLFFNEL